MQNMYNLKWASMKLTLNKQTNPLAYISVYSILDATISTSCKVCWAGSSVYEWVRWETKLLDKTAHQVFIGVGVSN